MAERTRANALQRMVAPGGLAVISLLVFAVAWICPPRIYSYYIEEKDLLFGDFTSLAYFILCFLSFIGGVSFIRYLAPPGSAKGTKLYTRIPVVAYLLFPLALGAGFTISSSILTLKEYPAILLLVVSGAGEEIKNSPIILHTPFGLADTWLLGIVWWAIWRSGQLEMQLQIQRYVKTAIALCLALCFFSAILKVSRIEFMLPVAGTAILYAAKRGQRVQSSYMQLFRYFAAFMICTSAIFVLLAMVRGHDLDGAVSDFMGYTVASYNRMAAVVHGRIRYVYRGQGTYLITCLAFNNLLNKVIPLADFFKWPDFYDWWQSEFTTTWNAGLDGNYIWSGAFGYMFADLGWLTPFWLFGEGALFGWLWRNLKLGRTSGIFLYPWAAFSILFWFGNNIFVENKLTVFVAEALLFAIYDWLLTIVACEDMPAFAESA